MFALFHDYQHPAVAYSCIELMFPVVSVWKSRDSGHTSSWWLTSAGWFNNGPQYKTHPNWSDSSAYSFGFGYQHARTSLRIKNHLSLKWFEGAYFGAQLALRWLFSPFLFCVLAFPGLPHWSLLAACLKSSDLWTPVWYLLALCSWEPK